MADPNIHVVDVYEGGDRLIDIAQSVYNDPDDAKRLHWLTSPDMVKRNAVPKGWKKITSSTDQSTQDPYVTPKQTGVSYQHTTPEVYGWNKWIQNQYPTSTDWPSAWHSTVLYDQVARDKPVGVGGVYNYNKTGAISGQNVWTPPQDYTPLILLAGATLLYRTIYS